MLLIDTFDRGGNNFLDSPLSTRGDVYGQWKTDSCDTLKYK